MINFSRIVIPGLLLITVLSLSACQKPHLIKEDEPQEKPLFTANVDYLRRSFIACELILPLQLQKEKNLNGTIIGNIIPVGNTICFVTANGFIYSMRGANFKNSARVRPMRGINTAPTYSAGKLYIAAQRQVSGLNIYDFNERKITEQLPAAFSASAPIVFQDKIIHVQSQGIIQCLDEKTLREIWKIETGHQILNSLAFDGAVLYAATLNGEVTALQAETGVSLWETKLECTIRATPVLSQNNLILVSLEGQAFQLDKQSGQIVNKIKLQAPAFTTPSTDGNFLFIPLSNGLINAYELNSLTLKWQKKLDSPVTIPALVLNQSIIIGTEKQLLCILDKKDGHTLQEIKLEGRLRAQPLVYEGGLILGYEYRKLALFKAIAQ